MSAPQNGQVRMFSTLISEEQEKWLMRNVPTVITYESDLTEVVANVVGRNPNDQVLRDQLAVEILRSVPISLDFASDGTPPPIRSQWLSQVSHLALPTAAFLDSKYPMETSKLPRATKVIGRVKGDLPGVTKLHLDVTLHCNVYEEDMLDRKRFVGSKGETTYRKLLVDLVSAAKKLKPDITPNFQLTVLSGSGGRHVGAHGKILEAKASQDIHDEVTK